MGMLAYREADFKFNFRVVGVLIKNGKLLIHRSHADDFYALPGGRAEMGENTETTIIREMEEELQIKVTVERLLFVNEAFFDYADLRFHELGFYYLLNCDDENLKLDHQFEVNENGTIFEFRWVDLDEIANEEVYPLFIRQRITSLPQTVEKFVEIDNIHQPQLHRR